MSFVARSRVDGWGALAGRAVGIAVTFGVLMTLIPGPANARPVYPTKKQVAAAKHGAKSKAEQVRSIQAKLQASEDKLRQAEDDAEIAAEKYNGASVELQRRTQEAHEASKAAQRAEARAGLAQMQIGRLAAEAYMNGGLSPVAALVASGGPEDVVDRAAGLQIVGSIRQRTLAAATQTRVEAQILRRRAAVALARQETAATAARDAKQVAESRAEMAQRITDSTAATRDTLLSELARLQRISVDLARQRHDGLVRAREAAAERARRRAATASSAHGVGGDGSAPSGGGGSSTGTAAGGRIAVAFARAQLGKWYLWAAAGPTRYDCSGLTMRSWESAGVYLPHYSVAQYAVTQRVSMSSMRPGDLLFYATNTANPSTIHHVAIYIGGSRMIEAAHAGTQVRIASIWRSGMMPYAGRP